MKMIYLILLCYKREGGYLEEEAPETREESLRGNNHGRGGLGGLKVLGAVPAVELDEEVVLDPEELAKGSDGLVFSVTVKVQGLDAANEDSLDVAEQGVDVDQVDVDLTLLGGGVGVDTGDVLQVLDHALVVGVVEEFGKVAAQHVLAELDLFSVLLEVGGGLDHLVLGNKALVALGHDVPGDIEPVELAVDGVDDDGDQRLDQLGGALDGVHVLVTEIHELGDILEAVDGVGVQLGSFNVLHFGICVLVGLGWVGLGRAGWL